MSIYSAKHRIVTATILVAGLQCGLVVPSVAAESPVTTHSAMQKPSALNADQAEDNQKAQSAASTITMKAQLRDGGYLLRWTGFPEDLEASNVLVDVNFYTPSGEYGGSVLESPTLTEGTKEGEFRLLMSPATDSNVVYVIVLEDTAHGVSYEFFVTERDNRLVEAADPRNGKAKPTEPPVDIEREEAETAEATAQPTPEAVNLPSPTATSTDTPPTDTGGDTVRRTVDNRKNKDSGRYAVSEDNSVYDPMNQRDGKAHLSIQDSQGDSQDDTKPVTVRATNFPRNDKGYDLIVMEIDSNGNTVGDALAIVHVGPESISAGAFEAVIGVPGASLQIGKTYLVAAFDAGADGNLQLNTVRFTVTQASIENGGSSSDSKNESESAVKPSANPTIATDAAGASGANAPAAGSKSKTRGIQADTAMAPGTKDATISVSRPSGGSAAESSSALGYRTGEAQPVQVVTPESNLPSGTDSAAQSRRAAILNGSSSQVRNEPGAPNGVKATEAQITRNTDKSLPLLPILVILGGGLILGALGVSRAHTSKKD